MNKQQLASKIWASANKMRSKSAPLIDNLTGSDCDMAGLREFQKLLRHE